MTKRQAEKYHWLCNALTRLGFDNREIDKLLKIERTLHRWCERECGDGSGAIERDESSQRPFWRSATSGKVYPVADREKGALNRLAAIMATKPDLIHYYQTDPRGCALYILRRDQVAEGEQLDSVYSRGIAVCL